MLELLAMIAEYTAVHLQELKDAGKPAANLLKCISSQSNSLKAFFCVQKKVFKLELLFHCLLQMLLTALPNCHAHVRIGPMRGA